MKTKKPKSDDDFIALDDAIGTLLDWKCEICDELAKRSISERTFNEVIAALDTIHDGDEL